VDCDWIVQIILLQILFSFPGTLRFSNTCHVEIGAIHLLGPGLTSITWRGWTDEGDSFIPGHWPDAGVGGCRGSAPSHLPPAQHNFLTLVYWQQPDHPRAPLPKVLQLAGGEFFYPSSRKHSSSCDEQW